MGDFVGRRVRRESGDYSLFLKPDLAPPVEGGDVLRQGEARLFARTVATLFKCRQGINRRAILAFKEREKGDVRSPVDEKALPGSQPQPIVLRKQPLNLTCEPLGVDPVELSEAGSIDGPDRFRGILLGIEMILQVLR